jgi:putative copper export protein/methionine-rich copper-binding protein CopC
MKERFPIRQLALGSALSLLCSVLLWISTLHAHALLVRSTPDAGAELAIAPPTVEFWFSEPLEESFSRAYLVDGAGNEIGRGTSVVDPDDPFHMTLPLTGLSPGLFPGIYTVVWETLSQADGHRWVGSFPLTLLNPDGSRPAGGAGDPFTPDAAQQGEMPTLGAVISRWLALLGAMLLFGVLFMRTQTRGIHAPGPAVTANFTVNSAANSGDEPKTGAGPGEFVAIVERSVIILLLVGVAGVILGGWLHWLTQALAQRDLAALPDLVFGTRGGALILIRQMLAGVALLGIVASLPLDKGLNRALLILAPLYAIGMLFAAGWLVAQRPEPFLALGGGIGLAAVFASVFLWLQGRCSPLWPALQRAMTWLLLLIAALILASFSLGSHAAAVTGSGWAILADLFHLVAAAIWLGGLLLLALVLWQARRLEAPPAIMALRRLVARFSAIATVAIFALTVTGVFSSFVQLRSFDQLWSTTYGWVLLAKVALVGATLALALLNHRFVGGAAAYTWKPSAERPFLRRVWTEATVSLVLMVVVAILVQTPVPLSPAEPAVATNTLFQEVLTADDLSIHFLISPTQPGNNLYQAHLYHEDGSAIGEVQLVRLFFVHQEVELGQASLDLVEQGGDFYGAEGAYQNRSGPWDVSVYVRRRGLDDALVETTVTVPEPVVNIVGGPWENPIPAWPPDTPVTGLLLSVGVGVLIWRWVRRKAALG